MIRKYHNHKPDNPPPWHREEEPLNHHEKLGRKTEQSNQLSLTHQDDCNTGMDTKQCTTTTQHRTITDPHNGSKNKQKSQQQQNHRLRMDSSLGYWGA